MIKALIVDDKTAPIELLRWLIKENCPDITSVVSAISVQEALPLIENYEPDLVFLDIQMPQQSGFDLLSSVRNWNFEVVFTTAYNEYAIQAIRFSALDYLLKPVQPDELIKAVERFKAKRIYAPAGEELYRNFLQNVATPKKSLALPGVNDIQYVELEDIVRLQAERNYTKFFFSNKKEFLSAKTLKEYEELLTGSGFIRVHRTHLVNTRYIKLYDREGILRLKDDSEVEVSRRKKDLLLNFFKSGELRS
mgnify:CR=1 FL=1